MQYDRLSPLYAQISGILLLIVSQAIVRLATVVCLSIRLSVCDDVYYLWLNDSSYNYNALRSCQMMMTRTLKANHNVDMPILSIRTLYNVDVKFRYAGSLIFCVTLL